MTGRLAPRRSIAGVYTMSARLKCLQARAGMRERKKRKRPYTPLANTHLPDNMCVGMQGAEYLAGCAHVSQDQCYSNSPTSLRCLGAQASNPAVWAAQAQQQACSPQQERPLMSFQLGLHLTELLLESFSQLLNLQVSH